MVKKTKWKPLGLPLLGKNVTPRQYCISGGIRVTSTAIKDLKETGWQF